ncbi:MAG: hypothetical protein AB7P20_07550 [Rhizobiaceae bacterium]
MKPLSFTRRLLLALALVGLVLGPMAAAATIPAMAAQAMASMPDGMPCCPDDQPAVPDCAKDCPLAIFCVSGFVSVPVPQAPSVVVHVPTGDEFRAGRDVILSSLVAEPPPRPPKA